MKIMTIVGTRPELIRLSIIIKKLDNNFEHILVHTNQNFDYNLNKKFFEELSIREPNYYLNNGSKTIGSFLGDSYKEFEVILDNEMPDKILILGDTNSGLLGILAAKRGIPVYHMEAGNRCYDDRVPEELNRRIIDAASTYNLPYTENSKENLIREGYHKNKVFKTGNPIFEILCYYKDNISNSKILEDLALNDKDYVLVTAHRSENVDDAKSLMNIIDALNEIAKDIKIVLSLHPRTKSKILGIKFHENITISEPFGFFDFVKLEQHAKCVISDSGTVQEECCIYNVPSVTIRETTERQETIECGSNILSGTDKTAILNSFQIAMNMERYWEIPKDYTIMNVSDIVINILGGKK